MVLTKEYREQRLRTFHRIGVGVSYHIWVVPMAGPGVGDDGVLVVSVVVDDARHGLPAVLDVVEVAPNVAGADDRLVVWLQRDIEYHGQFECL